MDIRGSIFRITESGVASAGGGFVDFEDLSAGRDEPLLYDTGCFEEFAGSVPECSSDRLWIRDGETGTFPRDNQCAYDDGPLGYRAFAHPAPHSDTGFHDGFFSVTANASEPDGIRRLVRFHSPVECTGTGQGPQDAVDLGAVGGAIGGAVLSDATMDWVNSHAVHALGGDGKTWGGHTAKYSSFNANIPSSVTSCFQSYNFKEYQYPFSLNELYPWGGNQNSTISGWVNPCDDINLTLESLSTELEYVPVSVKFANLSDLPTFFSVSACLNGLSGFGKGFGATDPNATGASGNKGEYDFDDALFNEFTCYGEMMYETSCRPGAASTSTAIYPHTSGFVEPGTTSCEYLIDSAFDYFVVQVMRLNGDTINSYSAHDFCSSNMVQDMWIVSKNGVAASVMDVWMSGFPDSGTIIKDSNPYDDIEPYGRLPLFGGTTATATSTSSYLGLMVPRWHELEVPAMDTIRNASLGGGGILISYGEPKIKIDTLTPPSIESAVIPSVGNGYNNPHYFDALVNTDIQFGPYSGNHFLFDLVSGVVCMEHGAIDYQGSSQWEYNYEFMSPFNDGPNSTWMGTNFYGGFVLDDEPSNPFDWVMRVGTRCGGGSYSSNVDPWTSGFNAGASGWHTPPSLEFPPLGGSLYLTTQRSLPAGTEAVHDIRDYPCDNFNMDGNGPYLRESLFEMALQSGTGLQGHIEGLMSSYLEAEYDDYNGAGPNNPLESYQNVFQSEPVVIDVYRVDKTLTVGTY